MPSAVYFRNAFQMSGDLRETGAGSTHQHVQRPVQQPPLSRKVGAGKLRGDLLRRSHEDFIKALQKPGLAQAPFVAVVEQLGLTFAHLVSPDLVANE